MKDCILESKPCTDCGRCDTLCELNPSKVCDNCCRCLGIDELQQNEYADIPISKVFLDDEWMSRRTRISVKTIPAGKGSRRID